MYGFFCYIWNATLGGEFAFLDPIVQYGGFGPLIGFPAAIFCFIYGKLLGKILSIPLICFHGFWLLWLICAILRVKF